MALLAYSFGTWKFFSNDFFSLSFLTGDELSFGRFSAGPCKKVSQKMVF